MQISKVRIYDKYIHTYEILFYIFSLSVEIHAKSFFLSFLGI